MADALVITKADGSNHRKAELAKVQFAGALSLFPVPLSGIRPEVMTCSAINNTGISEIWDYISSFIKNSCNNGYFSDNRKVQQHYWFYETIKDNLNSNFFNDEKVKAMLPELEKNISQNKISSLAAANTLLDIFFRKK